MINPWVAGYALIYTCGPDRIEEYLKVAERRRGTTEPIMWYLDRGTPKGSQTP
jgi:hypothetical protein